MAGLKGTAMESIVPTEQELKGFDLANPDIVELINHAQQSDAADRQLTIRQALKKYKKAVFWAMFLSTSLIMEGYDLVIVRAFESNIFSLHLCTRSWE
jgi:SP family general alpha glucoside:H+ symporter-like MFS transporter